MKNDKMMFNDMALENALGRLTFSGAQTENQVNMPVLPPEMVLAMAYMPLQIFKETYDIHEGFNAGTIFPELNKPFMPGESR